MSSVPGFVLEALNVATLPGARADLAALLQACVDAGGSLGYLAPMPADEATAYFDSVAPSVAAGTRVLLALRQSDTGRIVGSGQLVCETRPNGRHRAEICKLLVLPAFRRRGLASWMMHTLESHARSRGLRMLYLDTSEGRGGAQALYEGLGYTYAGGIPDWAVDPDGTPAKNAIYFKQLTLPPASTNRLA